MQSRILGKICDPPIYGLGFRVGPYTLNSIPAADVDDPRVFIYRKVVNCVELKPGTYLNADRRLMEPFWNENLCGTVKMEPLKPKLQVYK